MKINLDFITNSSSTMFIIELGNKTLRKDIQKKFEFHHDESFRFFKNKKNLINFTEAGRNDWIAKARGVPSDFYNMDKICYKEAAEILDRGKFIAYARIDRNDCYRIDRFRDIIEEYDGTILLETGD